MSMVMDAELPTAEARDDDDDMGLVTETRVKMGDTNYEKPKDRANIYHQIT